MSVASASQMHHILRIILFSTAQGCQRGSDQTILSAHPTKKDPIMPRPSLIHVIATLLCSAALLTGCGGGEEPVASEPAIAAATVAVQTMPTATATPAPTAAEIPSDPQAAVIAAMRAQANAGPYRNQTTIISDDETVELSAEVIPPDRMRITNNLGGQSQEQILIGDQGWLKQGDTWVESPMSGTDLIAQASGEMVDEIVKTISDVTLIGPEPVDGVDALVYSYTSDMNKSDTMKMDVIGSVKVWIATGSGLIIKQEIDDEMMGVKSKTVQVITYDPNITIEPPVE